MQTNKSQNKKSDHATIHSLTYFIFCFDANLPLVWNANRFGCPGAFDGRERGLEMAKVENFRTSGKKHRHHLRRRRTHSTSKRERGQQEDRVQPRDQQKFGLHSAISFRRRTRGDIDDSRSLLEVDSVEVSAASDAEFRSAARSRFEPDSREGSSLLSAESKTGSWHDRRQPDFKVVECDFRPMIFKW